jgi:hypothetical protein
LSYIPTAICFVKESGKSYWNTIYLNSGEFYFLIGSTNLEVYAQAGDVVKYYILYDPLQSTGGDSFTPSGDLKFMMSKSGVSVEGAKAHELSFNLDWNTFMLYDSKKIDVTASGSGEFTKAVSHGLAYAPAWLATIKLDTGLYSDPYVFADEESYLLMQVRMDSSNITCVVDSNVLSGETISFYVHILTEDL